MNVTELTQFSQVSNTLNASSSYVGNITCSDVSPYTLKSVEESHSTVSVQPRNSEISNPT